MRFMVSTPAQSSIKSSPNSEILRQRPSAPKSRTKSTLGFVPDGCFLVFHLFGEFLKNRLIERIALSKPFRILVMYVMYIRRVYGRAFSRSSSQSDGFNKPFYLANNCVKIPRLSTRVRLVRWVLLQTGVSLSFISIRRF